MLSGHHLSCSFPASCTVLLQAPPTSAWTAVQVISLSPAPSRYPHPIPRHSEWLLGYVSSPLDWLLASFTFQLKSKPLPYRVPPDWPSTLPQSQVSPSSYTDHPVFQVCGALSSFWASGLVRPTLHLPGVHSVIQQTLTECLLHPSITDHGNMEMKQTLLTVCSSGQPVSEYTAACELGRGARISMGGQEGLLRKCPLSSYLKRVQKHCLDIFLVCLLVASPTLHPNSIQTHKSGDLTWFAPLSPVPRIGPST